MLFIYGTLRKEGVNRGVIEKQIKSFSVASVTGTMFTDGRIPFLLKNGNTRITGELVELINEVENLKKLDEFETGEYVRERINVTTDSGTQKTAWAYLYYKETMPNDAELIQSGDWIQYCNHK